jgi:hypothetical protein
MKKHFKVFKTLFKDEETFQSYIKLKLRKRRNFLSFRLRKMKKHFKVLNLER